MIAVIFEVVPHPSQKNLYLDIAAKLRDELQKIDGFISVERFQSLTDPKKLLSISFFEDEKSVEKWRNLEAHRFAQEKGRSGVFLDYRLRVAKVMRDYGMNNREEAPTDSLARHDRQD